MITLRYHLVTLMAVFVALTFGIVVGAGWLSDTRAPLPTATDAAPDDQTRAFEDAFATETSGELLSGALNGHSVAILALPGAREDEISALVTNVRTAGARVTSQGRLTAALVDPANRQFAEQVASEAAPDDVVSDGDDSYAKVGQAISRIFLGRQGRQTDDTSQSLLDAMSEADLVTWSTAPSAYADLVIVMAGPGDGADSAPLLRELTSAMAGAGDGVVVAGPTDSGRSQGFIGSLRDLDLGASVSTVDVTDSAAGRIVTVLALAASADDQGGSWGTDGSADGAVPQK